MPEPDTVAILTEALFEDLELLYPMYRLQEAGYEVEVLTPDGRPRKGEHGYEVEAVGSVADADAEDYAAIHIPGGVTNPDRLRMDDDAVEFVERFVDDADGPVFAICHGPWMLVEADVVEDVELTSYPSLRADLENAGATWVDRPVVVDGRFVTSRHWKDLPNFANALLEALGGPLGRIAPSAGWR